MGLDGLNVLNGLNGIQYSAGPLDIAPSFSKHVKNGKGEQEKYEKWII